MTLLNLFFAFERPMKARRADASLPRANPHRNERCCQPRTISQPTSSVSALTALVIDKLTDVLCSSTQTSYESERIYDYASQNHQGLSFTYLSVTRPTWPASRP